MIPEVNIFAFLNRQTLLKLLILAFLMKGLGWRFVGLKGEAVTLKSKVYDVHTSLFGKYYVCLVY